MPEANFSVQDPAVPTSGLVKSDLIDFIRSKLGEGVWNVEITEDQLDIAIKTALRKYGKRLPYFRYGHIDAVPEQTEYTFPADLDLGFGVAKVTFVKPIFFGSAAFVNKRLLGVTTVGSYRLDEYDIFARWRQTFERVTSTLSQWMYEEETKKLWIYNPIPSTKICYMTMHPIKELSNVRLNDEDWIYEYCLALCKQQLGENRSKFGSAIPGPAKDLQLNSNTLLEAANKKIEALEEELKKIQRRPPPEFF